MRFELYVIFGAMLVLPQVVRPQAPGPGGPNITTTTTTPNPNPTSTMKPPGPPGPNNNKYPWNIFNCDPVSSMYSPSWCTCDCDNTESKQHHHSNDDDDDDYDWHWWKGIDVNAACIPHCSVSLTCKYPPSCQEQLRALNELKSVNSRDPNEERIVL